MRISFVNMANSNKDKPLNQDFLDALKDYTCYDMEKFMKSHKIFNRKITTKELEFLCRNMKCYVSMNQRNVLQDIKDVYKGKLYRNGILRIDYLKKIIRLKNAFLNVMYAEHEEIYTESKHRMWVQRRFDAIEDLILIENKKMLKNCALTDTSNIISDNEIDMNESEISQKIIGNSVNDFFGSDTENDTLPYCAIVKKSNVENISTKNLSNEANSVHQGLETFIQSDESFLSSQSAIINLNGVEISNDPAQHSEGLPEYLAAFDATQVRTTSTQRTEV